MTKILVAICLVAMTSSALAQAGGAAQGAQPVSSAPSAGEKLTIVLLAGVVAAIIANNTPSANNTASNH